MATYTLNYGKGTVNFEVPQNWQTKVLKHSEPKSVSLKEALVQALENPFGQKPFREWIRMFKDVLIIVPDVTRYAGMERVLPILYDEYLKDIKTRIIFALGNHRKQSEEEMKGIVSDSIYDRVQCFDHDCFNDNVLSSIGQTASGLEIKVNEALVDADAVIVTGSINFHYLAGFGGGRKSIFPGIAGYETILGIHKKVFRENRLGKHDLAKSGTLDGNPMHEEIMEAVELIKTPLYLINAALDDKKNFLNIFAGDIREAHFKGCSWYREHFAVGITERADIAIVSSGGFPKDINFIQSHKAIEHAMGAVKDNGVVIINGKCEDGLGNQDFLRWFEYATIAEMEPHVRASDKVYAQTAYATRCKAERCNILLVSDLTDEQTGKMGLTPHRTVQDAIDSVDDGEKKLCYIIPDGSNTLIV
jgi:nickel-dependent lactate racemase